MSIWRDIYLAMPKGERFEFAKRTLSVPHFKAQAAADIVFHDREEGDSLGARPPGVVVSPWTLCCVEARDSFGVGFFTTVGCSRLTQREAGQLQSRGFARAEPGRFLLSLRFWFDSMIQTTTAESEFWVLVVLADSGRLLDSGALGLGEDHVVFLPRAGFPAEHVENTCVFLAGLTRVVLAAFGLAHCKNVKVEETTEPAPKCVRREGFPDAKVTYRTLAMGGPAKSARRRLEEDAEEASIQRALHICRGHFAEYGPEAPLFGKHTGQFWVPQHVRGTEKAGRVVKDYEIRKPTGGAP